MRKNGHSEGDVGSPPSPDQAEQQRGEESGGWNVGRTSVLMVHGLGGGGRRYLPQLPWENKASWEMKSFQHVWVLSVPAGMPRPHI